jgi:hypothetical protein
LKWVVEWYPEIVDPAGNQIGPVGNDPPEPCVNQFCPFITNEEYNALPEEL